MDSDREEPHLNSQKKYLPPYIWIPVLLIAVALAIYYVLVNLDGGVIKDISANDEILFQKEEFWGPCPPEAICNQLTIFYESGKLVRFGGENDAQLLSEEVVNAVKAEIEAAGIFNIRCKEEGVEDYWATYTLNLDGREKMIDFPGCEQELNQIDAILNLNS